MTRFLICLVVCSSSLVSTAKADLSFLPPWSCDGAEASEADRESYFHALQSSAVGLLAENREDIERRREVFTAQFEVTVGRDGVLREGDDGYEDFTAILRSELIALQSAAQIVEQQTEIIDELEGAIGRARWWQDRILEQQSVVAADPTQLEAMVEGVTRSLNIVNVPFTLVGTRDGILVDLARYPFEVRSGNPEPARASAINGISTQYLLPEEDLVSFFSCPDAAAHKRNRFSQIVSVLEADLINANKLRMAASWPINDAPVGRGTLKSAVADLNPFSAPDLLTFSEWLEAALDYTLTRIDATRAQVEEMSVNNAHELATHLGVATAAYQPQFEDVACIIRSEVHVGWRTFLRVGAFVTGIASMFVNPALGFILLGSSVGASLADAAVRFYDARQAQALWHTGYDQSALLLFAVHKRLYVEAWAALGFAVLRGAVEFHQMRILSNHIRGLSGAAQSDAMGVLSLRHSKRLSDTARATRYAARVTRISGRIARSGRIAFIRCASAFCTPVPFATVNNINDGHQARNLALLDEIPLTQGARFTGAYNPETRQALARPDAGVLFRDGTVPDGAVLDYEGVAAVSEELAMHTGTDPSNHIRFYLEYGADGGASVVWATGPALESASPEDLAAALEAISEMLGTDLTSNL